MIFRITFKDPDGVSSSMDSEASCFPVEIEDWELEALKEARIENMQKGMKDWVRYEEYVTIEFDTKQNTAKVIKNNEED